MEYVIFETGGKQYKAQTGSVIDVESLGLANGVVAFDKVLLHVSGDNVVIGAPYIAGVSVEAEVKGAKKGQKIRVSQFKAKSRHRRVTGHRQSFTTVEIKGVKSEKTAPKTKK